MLPATPYRGTLSKTPREHTDDGDKAARERKGKYRANRRQPRTRQHNVPSLIDPRLPDGTCISYRIGDDGKATNIKLFRARGQRQRTTRGQSESESQERARQLREAAPEDCTHRESHGLGRLGLATLGYAS